MVDIIPFASNSRADPAQRQARPVSAASLAGVRPKFRGDGIVLDVFLLLEMLAVHLCGFAAAALYVGIRLGVDNYYGQYSAAFLMLPIIFALLLKSRGLYQAPRIRNFSGSIGGVVACLLGAFGLLIIIGFALGLANDYSRVWYGLWLTSAIPTVIATRAAAAGFLGRAARSGLIRRKAAIYGDAESIRRVVAELGASSSEIQMYGTFLHAAEAGQAAILSALVAEARERDLDLVIIAFGYAPGDKIEAVLAALRTLPVEVRLYLDLGGQTTIRGISSLNGLHRLEIQRRPISEWNVVLKAAEDYLVAGIAVVLLSPLLLLIAVAIRLDSKGPVLFRQRRHGFNHRVFSVWKFRTMNVMEDGEDMVQAVAGDHRVTRVGRILRRTSLDELPQIFNVLKGEMSVVGPRPHPLALNNRYQELMASYSSRHKVKPGITGWAQINGLRGATADPALMNRRVELDLEYIENWSIWADLKIIAATPFLGLVHKNAL